MSILLAPFTARPPPVPRYPPPLARPPQNNSAAQAALGAGQVKLSCKRHMQWGRKKNGELDKVCSTRSVFGNKAL